MIGDPTEGVKRRHTQHVGQPIATRPGRLVHAWLFVQPGATA